jgi:CheY-like chemotaxis protein
VRKLAEKGIVTLQILVVDDDQDMREVMVEVLEEEGFIVASAADGREALDKLGTARPLVMVLDMMMPVMDGRAVLAALADHATLRTLPVLVFTAQHDLAITIERGATVAVLQKPVTVQRLVEKLREMIADGDGAG